MALGFRCGENCVYALRGFVKVGAFAGRGFCGEGSIWQTYFIWLSLALVPDWIVGNYLLYASMSLM